MHSIADPHALYAHAGVGTFNKIALLSRITSAIHRPVVYFIGPPFLLSTGCHHVLCRPARQFGLPPSSLSSHTDFRVESLGTHETAVSQGPPMGGREFYGDTTRFGLCGTHSLDHPGHKGRERIKADPRTGKGCIVSQTHMRFMRMLAWERSTRSPCCRE